MIRPNYLAPDIVAWILDGKHPGDLTANKLIAATRLPAIAMEEAQCRTRFARSLDGHADGPSNCLAIVEDMESGSALLQLLEGENALSLRLDDIRMAMRRRGFLGDQCRFEAGRDSVPDQASWLAEYDVEVSAFSERSLMMISLTPCRNCWIGWP